ncbi:MAG: hypothetical protein OSJ60_18640 [Lachnospiraceae bacterium]|jgi:hypothetical protein|nr:hypothetical protein [Lachnospiraceae bacterium]
MKRKIIIQLYLLTAFFILERFVPVSNYVLPKENNLMLLSVAKTDRIGWRYETREDGRLYKRLYNYTADSWIGEWILVG